MKKNMKKFLAVVMSFVMVMCFMTGSTSIFAASPLVTEVTTSNAMTKVMTTDGMTEEIPEATVFITANGGGISPMANSGPIAETPQGWLVDEDAKTVSGGKGYFTFVVPAGKTVNAVYLTGKNTSGYSTTVDVDGLGSSIFRADLNGIWYRVSSKGLGYTGPTNLTVIVRLLDKSHSYNIAMMAMQ